MQAGFLVVQMDSVESCGGGEGAPGGEVVGGGGCWTSIMCGYMVVVT